MTQNSVPLTINFASEKAAREFAIWMCEQGEQDYWVWMEAQEERDSDPVLTATRFHYHHPKEGEKSAGDNFMSKLEINTTCARFDN